MKLSEQTVERLSAMRRHLRDLEREGTTRVFSHELAKCWRSSAAQVRRDLMLIEYPGSNARGYDIAGLRARIDAILPIRDGAALVGVGHLGRALLSYFVGGPSTIEVRAAFDVDAELVGRAVHGCPCHHTDELESVLAQTPVKVGIVAVPAGPAQDVATRLVGAGVTGLVNFSPVVLNVPADVFIQKIDIAVLLEKTAFFAQSPRRETAGCV